MKIRIKKLTLDGSDLENKSLSKQLRGYRKALGLVARDLSKSCFGNSTTIYQLESGGQRDTFEHIAAYCQYLGVKELTIKF